MSVGGGVPIMCNQIWFSCCISITSKMLNQGFVIRKVVLTYFINQNHYYDFDISAF